MVDFRAAAVYIYLACCLILMMPRSELRLGCGHLQDDVAARMRAEPASHRCCGRRCAPSSSAARAHRSRRSSGSLLRVRPSTACGVRAGPRCTARSRPCRVMCIRLRRCHRTSAAPCTTFEPTLRCRGINSRSTVSTTGPWRRRVTPPACRGSTSTRRAVCVAGARGAGGCWTRRCGSEGSDDGRVQALAGRS